MNARFRERKKTLLFTYLIDNIERTSEVEKKDAAAAEMTTKGGGAAARRRQC